MNFRNAVAALLFLVFSLSSSAFAQSGPYGHIGTTNVTGGNVDTSNTVNGAYGSDMTIHSNVWEHPASPSQVQPAPDINPPNLAGLPRANSLPQPVVGPPPINANAMQTVKPNLDQIAHGPAAIPVLNALGDQCKRAMQNAEKNCESGSLSSTAAAVMQSVAAKTPTNPTDAYSACKALRAQSMVAMGGSALVGTMCLKSANTCQNVCEEEYNTGHFELNKGAISNCRDMAHKGEIGMGGNVALAALGFSQAAQCDSVIRAVEGGVCAPMNTQCITQCANNPQACNPVNCSVPANQATFYCQMMAQTSGGLGSNGLPAVDTGGSGTFDENGQGFQGYKSNPQAAQGGGEGAGGGGGFGLNSGAYPGGADKGAAAKEQTGYNGDVEHGYTGGGGAGWPTGGGGSVVNPSRDNRDIDLSKYLPGGELDPARGLAGEDALKANGITGANELSNFEKVTRMMNKKRPYLKAGDK